MPVSVTLYRRRYLLAGFALAPLFFPTATEAGGVWDALREPGSIALIRHARAPGTGDPDHFQLDDCSTQRNLNQAGRQQARAIGDAFRANNIAVDRILSSQWCRCLETAELLDLAPVEEFPPLNSFYEDRSTRTAQTESVLDYLVKLPKNERAVLVTHQVNITALTGRPVGSGEMFVIKIDADGQIQVLGNSISADH